MTAYVALLRGINVGGRTSVEMARLRRVFADLGHEDAQTYLQSGNVVFSGPPGGDGAAGLGTAIQRRIAKELDVSVTVLLRTAEELARVAEHNPFLGGGADPTTLHVTFLADAPEPARVGRLAAPEGVTDELALVEREVFLRCPNGYGRTKLNNAFFERKLGVAATTRNWRTVTKLREMAGG